MRKRLDYRTRWKKATKRAYREARRRGAPISLQEASIYGQMWLTLMGVQQPEPRSFVR